VIALRAILGLTDPHSVDTPADLFVRSASGGPLTWLKWVLRRQRDATTATQVAELVPTIPTAGPGLAGVGA
jgi:hypothetical protein